MKKIFLVAIAAYCLCFYILTCALATRSSKIDIIVDSRFGQSQHLAIEVAVEEWNKHICKPLVFQGQCSAWDPCWIVLAEEPEKPYAGFTQGTIDIGGTVKLSRLVAPEWAYASVLHELGHVIGLEHSNVPTSLMAPVLTTSIIQPDDIKQCFDKQICCK